MYKILSLRRLINCVTDKLMDYL